MSSNPDAQFEELVAAYLEAAARGEAPSRAELLARHPEYAERLGRFLDNERWLRDAVEVGEGQGMPATVADAAAGVPMRLRYVGDYEVQEELGRGGMGVVYRARQISLRREVALKMVLSGEHASEDQLRRFRAEAEAAANLDHPNIVPVYEVGVHQGLPYFSMKLIEGRSLAQVDFRDRPRELAALMAKVARAVHHAHQRGVLHRDIKPGNILLDARGEPHIADFGLARRGEGGGSVSGAVIGTPEFMPPEQALGKKGLTTAADVYSLGATLYAALAQRPPFTSDNPEAVPRALEILGAVVNDEPPALPSAGDLGVIALKCLSKDPAKRYESAAGLADDLDRWLNGEPILARPAGRVERLWRWCRRNRAAAAFIGVLAAATLAASALTWWALTEKGRANREANEKDREAVAARKAEKKAKDNEALASKRKEDADYQTLRAEDALHAIQIDLALRAWTEGDVARSEQVLREMAPRFQHTWETEHLRGLCRCKARRFLGHTRAVTSVAYSPDGKRIASGSGGYGDFGEVKVWDAQSGQELLSIAGHKSGVLCVAFSPDGTRIVSASILDGVKVWDAKTGQEELHFQGHKGTVSSVAFSPDGNRIASGSEKGMLKVWDAKTGKEILSIRAHNMVSSVAYSPDGERIVSGGGINFRDRWGKGPGEAKVWDARTGKELLTLEGHTSQVTGVAYSPDGKHIASSSMDMTVKVWDAKTCKEKHTLADHRAWVRSVAFSPDGRYVASGLWDATGQIWDVETGTMKGSIRGQAGINRVAFSPEGRHILCGGTDGAVTVWDVGMAQEKLTIVGHMYAVSGVAWAPDGKRVLSQGGPIKVWDANTGRELLTIRGNEEDVDCAVFSPDGKHIAGGTSGFRKPGEVKVWDAATGKELLALAGHAWGVNCLAYSPDGRRIASGSEEYGKSAEVKVWDAATGKELLTFAGHADGVSCVAFSPDGARIASGGYGKPVKVWDATTGKTLLTLEGHAGAITSVAFSPDGGRIASGSDDRTVRVWDAETGQLKLSLPGHKGGVRGVAFSPNGRRLVSGGSESLVARPGEVMVWDAETGQLKLSLHGHTSGVHGVAFSPDADGLRILSGSNDATVKIWDAEPSNEPRVLQGHVEPVSGVGFSADGKRVCSKDKKGKRLDHDAATGEPLPPGGEQVPDGQLRARQPGGKLVAIVIGSLVILHVPPGPLTEADLFLRRQADFRWHRAQMAEAAKAELWPAAVFHLERVYRFDPTWGPALRLVLEKAVDSPLTQAVKRNLAVTDAARVASALGQMAAPGGWPALLWLPPGR